MAGLAIFDAGDVIVAESVDDAIICSMGHDLREVDANARLIAAAPEMLEALEAVEGGLTGLLIDYERTDPHSFSASNIRGDLFKLRAVIKKAKGE